MRSYKCQNAHQALYAIRIVVKALLKSDRPEAATPYCENQDANPGPVAMMVGAATPVTMELRVRMGETSHLYQNILTENCGDSTHSQNHDSAVLGPYHACTPPNDRISYRYLREIGRGPPGLSHGP